MIIMVIILYMSPCPQRRHDFSEYVDGRTGMVELSAAVVADDDSRETELGGAEGVVCPLDALEEDG